MSDVVIYLCGLFTLPVMVVIAYAVDVLCEKIKDRIELKATKLRDKKRK